MERQREDKEDNLREAQGLKEARIWEAKCSMVANQASKEGHSSKIWVASPKAALRHKVTSRCMLAI